MSLEILTKEDLQATMNSFKVVFLKEIKSLLDNKVGDEWLDGKAAMELLHCKPTKMTRLVNDGMIKKRGQGKGSRYSKKSILSYLERG